MMPSGIGHFLLKIPNKEKVAVHKDKETFLSSTVVEKPKEPHVKILRTNMCSSSFGVINDRGRCHPCFG